MKITSVSGICQTIYQNGKMAVIYCYLERGNDKVLKLNLNNSSFFEITATLNFKINRPPGWLLKKIRYLLCEPPAFFLKFCIY